MMKKTLLIAAILCNISLAGAQWKWIAPMPPEMEYNSLAHVSDQTYVMVGDNLILKTEDGGNSWFQTEHPQVSSLNKVYFLDEDIGFVVGGNANFLKSSDGGNSWIK